MLHNFRYNLHIDDQIADICWQDSCLDISNQPMRTLHTEHSWALQKSILEIVFFAIIQNCTLIWCHTDCISWKRGKCGTFFTKLEALYFSKRLWQAIYQSHTHTYKRQKRDRQEIEEKYKFESTAGVHDPDSQQVIQPYRP